MLSFDRARWEQLDISTDHRSVIREINVIPSQVEVIADVVECLAQLSLV
jgi:hypothetical protein